MPNRIITDISVYIFVSGEPQKVDASFLPGGSHPEQSGHTRDNAFLSRKAVDEKGIVIKSGIIVCKAFHARRCLMLYQMAFPNVDMTVCPVHCYNITKENWYTTEKGTDRVLGELARCGNQCVGALKTYLDLI